MNRDEKLTVDIRNRPSNRDQHTKGEWAEHIQIREAADTLHDLRTVRQGLGSLTTRFVIEAMCSGEPDADQLTQRMLSLVDGDELIGDIKVDATVLRKLADNVGGKKAKEVVEKSPLKEVQAEADVSEQQVELLRALLKTMDPAVIKKALSG